MYESIHVRITKEQYEWLRQYCFENRVAQAEVVREALELFRNQEEDARMAGGIRCYGCDFDYTEGYWLEIEGEDQKFYCQECADKASIVGQPGVYEHTDDGPTKGQHDMTYEQMVSEARRRALYSGTFTDDPKEKADDVYLVKDMDLVVKAFLKDIVEGDTAEYSEPAEFLDKHGIEWE